MSKPKNATPENQENESNSTIEVSSDGVAEVKSPTQAEPKAAEKAAETKPEAAVSKAEQPKAQAKTSATGNNMLDSKNNSSQSNTPAPVVVQQSGGKGLAAGALVLALLGLGASGFLFVQGQNVLKNQELAFNQKMDKAALGESSNASLLQDNLRKQAEVESQLSELSDGQKKNSEQIALANKAYQELMKGRVRWLVDETEATLNVADQQLLISGNVPAAVSVLENIESRLTRFDQPELTPIKQAISKDLAELKSRPYLDVTSASLRLDRLETAIAGLPLVVDNTLQPSKAASAPVDTSNMPWYEAAWEKTLNSLKGMVEVRKLDNNDAMLMSPEQVYFVRENLRLRMLDARTALLQRNSEVYQSDLNAAEATVKQYFDNKSPATQSWLKELADLKGLDISMASDDVLKNSLAAVRAYQDATSNTPVSALPDLSASVAASAPVAQAASEPAAVASASEKNTSASAAAAESKAASEPAAQPAEQKPAEQPASKEKGAQA